MKPVVCLIGLDEPETTAIMERVSVPMMAHPTLPPMYVQDGQLFIQSTRATWFVPVSKVVYHGIFDDDHDFIAGLALWGGACLPNPLGMMDCRLRLPCLVRALQHTRFGEPLRSFAAANVPFTTQTERVAKWGNWHCGENKTRFTDTWQSADAAIIEPFIVGRAVRIVLIGDQYWQIALEGDDWLKSIHHATADFMPVDADLLADTRRIQQAFGLQVMANDYMVTPQGTKHLLEVNHIPNVTRFPAIWAAYRDYVVAWLEQTA